MEAISRRCAVAQYLSFLYGGKEISCGCTDYSVFKSDGLMPAIGQKPFSSEMVRVVHEITHQWGVNGSHSMTKGEVIAVLEGIVHADTGDHQQG